MAWANGGDKSFKKFITLLSSSSTGTYRTLNLTKPNSDVLGVPNNRDNRIEFYSKLKVQISEDTDWSLSFEGDKTTMMLSVKTAKKLSEKISNVKNQLELSFEQISFWW